MELVLPDEAYLEGYIGALRGGWSPNTMRPEASPEELVERFERDAVYRGSAALRYLIRLTSSR